MYFSKTIIIRAVDFSLSLTWVMGGKDDQESFDLRENLISPSRLENRCGTYNFFVIGIFITIQH